MRKLEFLIALLLLLIVVGYLGVFYSNVGMVVDAGTFSIPEDKPFSIVPSFCGDGVCNSWESSLNCPIDCGSPSFGITNYTNQTNETNNTTGYIPSNRTEIIINDTNFTEPPINNINQSINESFNETNVTINIPKLNETSQSDLLRGGHLICTETDGGMNFYVAGEAIQSYFNNFSQVSQIKAKDRCLDKTFLEEQVCDGLSLSRVIYACKTSCYNGACVNENASINNSLSCSDTDSGKDYTTRGVVRDSFNNKFEDFCYNDKVLVEYYCDSNSLSSFKGVSKEYISCRTECSEGRCLGSSTWFIKFIKRLFS